MCDVKGLDVHIQNRNAFFTSLIICDCMIILECVCSFRVSRSLTFKGIP